MQYHRRGFTLVELMIAIAILAIITTIAVTLYQPYVRKGRRIDGINSLLTLSLAEERYRSTNTTYGTLAQLGASATSPEGYYALAVTSTSATSYTLTATTQGRQVGDAAGSTSCNTLTLTYSAGVVTKTPAACWPT